MMRLHLLISFAFALLCCLTGCSDSDLGECNLDGVSESGAPIEGPAAFDLAYRSLDGLPMFEGQAIVQASCGNGQFCHSPSAEGAERFGVPKGLDFDVALACTDASVDTSCADLQPCEGAGAGSAYCERLQRLESDQRHTASWGEGMIKAIREGSMPPGDAGNRVADDTPWYRPDGSELPLMGTSEATDIVRNWLACDAPVVARTQFPPTQDLELTPCPSLESEVCVYSGPAAPLPDPRWSSIYWSLIFQKCVICHGPANPNDDIPGGADASALAVLDLTGSDTTDTSNWPAESHRALVNVPASPAGLCAAQGINVIPNDSEGSLMIQKMRAIQTCGGEMPLGAGTQTIPDSVIGVISEWIDLGAPND